MNDANNIFSLSGNGKDLLPPNSTDLERKLSFYSTRIEALSVVTEQLMDASLCPEDMLPWLAWAMSVDIWRDEWNETIKRGQIEDSIRNHKRQGTRAAVRHAVRVVLAFADVPERNDINNITEYDNSFEIKEWWENNELDGVSAEKKKQPHTFELKLLIGKGVLGSRGILGRELYQELRKAIDTVRPISTRYTLSIGGAKFESACPLATRIRNARYARFLVKPVISLRFNTDMASQSYVRIARHENYMVKPVPKLVFTGTLAFQERVKVYRYCAWKLQPPYLKM